MNERAYYGHESQLFGVEEYRLTGGKGDGMRLSNTARAAGAAQAAPHIRKERPFL